jgi:hypothetical protein
MKPAEYIVVSNDGSSISCTSRLEADNRATEMCRQKHCVSVIYRAIEIKKEERVITSNLLEDGGENG